MSTTTAQLREQNQAKVRTAMLDAARTLFATEGVADLSMRRVAAKIGYPPRPLSLSFADTDDLRSELSEEAVDCCALHGVTSLLVLGRRLPGAK
ncbi:MAG: TetR/AcrR family transcriptional regulator [Candidatus Binatia bacterium]